VPFDCIELIIEGPIAHIRLNRPDKLNAINAAMVGELHRALDDAEARPQVRVITLQGSGRAFCSGFDLGEMSPDTDAVATRRTLSADFDIIMRFWHSPKPTLAAVHGYALGGGFELAMACDMTIAAEDAVFGEPEPKFGSGIVALLLPWITGPKQAKEMLLFSELATQEIAVACGFADPRRLTRAFTAVVGTAPEVWQRHRGA